MDNNSPKQVVLRFNREVIEQGKRASFDELVAPDFVNWSAPTGAPRDSSGLWHTFENVLRPALARLKVQIHDQLCDGDKVTTRKSVCGVHTGILMGIPATGRKVSIDVIDIVTVRDGRYAEHWGVNTLPAVLVQLRSS